MKYHYIILLVSLFFGCGTSRVRVFDTQGTKAEYDLLYVRDTSLVLLPVKTVRDLQEIHAEAFALPYSRISHVFRLGYSPTLPIIAGVILGIPVGGLFCGFIVDQLSGHRGLSNIDLVAGGFIIGMIVGGVAGGFVGDALTPKDRDVYLNDPKDILFLKGISRYPYEDPLKLKEIE